METISVALYALAFAIGLLVKPQRAVVLLLVLAALVPVEFILPPGAQQYFPPAFAGLVVLGLRSRPEVAGRLSTPVRFLLLALVLLGLSSMLYAPFNLQPPFRGIALAVVPAISLYVVGAAIRGDASLVPGAWMKIGASLGVFAIVERLVWNANPLYDSVYASGGLDQRWAEYRVTTTLGHPLVCSLFFGTATAFALGRCLERDRPGRRPLLLLALNATGLLLTLSRTGVAAVAAAALVVLVAVVVRGDRSSATKVLALMVCAVPAAYAAQYILSSRLASGEASTSSDFRSEILRLAAVGVREHPTLGFGADGLQQAGASLGLASGNFENSYVDLALAQGLPFALAWVSLAVVVAVAAARRGNYAALAGVTALSLSVAGFNFVFGHPSLLLLVGCVHATCLTGYADGSGRSKDARAKALTA